MLRRSLLTALIFLAASNAHAGIYLPKNMSHTDREAALRIVGFGTSSKLLTDPYPMGGYSGFEAGVAVEDVPTDALAQLGGHLSTPQEDVSYPKFTIGKGLYNNIDLFIDFTPYNSHDQLSQYGALLRWGFYQATMLPLSTSLVAHMNNGNVSNLMTTQTFGVDLIGGINVHNVAFFLGGGWIASNGTFIGGKDGVTDTANLTGEAVQGTHTLVGANIDFPKQSAFIAMQIDRYSFAVLSGKIGVRF